MTQLTKEEFEQILYQRLEKSENSITTAVTSKIIKRIDESQEELARMVAEGFSDIQIG